MSNIGESTQHNRREDDRRIERLAGAVENLAHQNQQYLTQQTKLSEQFTLVLQKLEMLITKADHSEVRTDRLESTVELNEKMNYQQDTQIATMSKDVEAIKTAVTTLQDDNREARRDVKNLFIGIIGTVSAAMLIGLVSFYFNNIGTPSESSNTKSVAIESQDKRN